MKRGRRLTISTLDTSFNASTRVLVRPIGFDMVEIGGSNPPGPTIWQTLATGEGCSLNSSAGSKRQRRSTNHDWTIDLQGVAFDDIRQVKTREAISLYQIRLAPPHKKTRHKAGFTCFTRHAQARDA